MKNFTNNFKQFTSRLSARWLIMALMMLVGTSSAWGKTFYLNPKWGNDTWDKDGAWFEAWVWGDNVSGSWAKATKGSVYYEITVNDNATKVIWLRKSNSHTSGNWDCLNRTSDVDLGETNNLTNITGWTNNEYCSFTTGTYNPCTTTTLTWNNDSSIKTSMKKGDTQTVSVTLSPSGAGTPTFTTSSSSVISLSGSGSSRTLTAEAAGSATITASFAEANGYCGSSITKTITVTDPCAAKYYIAGTLPGASWDASKHLEMTCVDGLRSYTFTDAGKGEYKFKITNNTWDSSWNTLNTSKSSGVTCKDNDGDGNMVFETPAEGNITIYFDDALKAWVTWEANCTKPNTPSIASSHSSICNGDNTQVTITVTGSAEQYQLYVKNNGYTQQGNAQEESTFTVSPTKTTTYVVKAFNGTCASDNYSNEITVEVSTKPNITLTEESKAICNGEELDLSDYASTTAGNLTWWDGNTQITEPVSPETNTTYTVKAVNGVCTVSNNFPVTVNPTPVAPFNGVEQSTTICNGTFNYEAAYNWYTSESGNQTVSGSATLDATTEYYISQITNGCESARTKYTVNVDTKPKVVLTTNEEESICQGDKINLEGYIEERSGTIKWYSDSEYNTEITELIFTPNTQQTYYVKATNGVCEPATASLSIKVIAKPTIPTFDTVDPRCDSYTLPTEDKNRLPIKWYETMESVTPLSDNTTVTASGTYYAEGVNGNCVSDSRTAVEVTINATPTITGKSVTQPNTEITLTSIQGVTWSVSPTENVILIDNGDGTATFSASVIGEFVVSAQKENCSTEYTITVTDKGNIIYVRRPKSEDGNNYTYWYNSAFMGEEYYGTQNYIKNGADFSTASENNKNGTAPTVPAAFTDCDGYVWDKFEVLGYESFFVHAPVQTGFGGYSTFTQTIDVALEQPEMYVTIGTWVSGLGAPITKVEAPSLVKVYASGETTLGANKFAALYVTDCSGREIDTYQWEYRSTEDETYTNYTASVSNNGTLYSGDAGTTNNIRPSVAGFYRCTVTYIGGGTATSAAEEVTGTYSYLESNIPVIVVNTNGVGFPDCPSTGGTASLNADVLKEKRSVDVKIYNGTTLVYDRKARMNYRGSSSLNFQKKSYAFCPGKDNCVEDKGRQDYVKTEKMNMLNVGTAKDKDWVLYASAADPTLMRNRLVFDTYQAMRPNDWGVHSRYVELIVDGEHKGVYVLMDKITKNDNRVKLNEDNGFIVKFDKTDCADRFGGYNNIWGDEKTFKTTYTGHDDVSTYDTHIDQRFEIEYPEKDDYTIGWSSKVKSIQAMFQAFEDALIAGEYATVQKYIDYDSWADWFIINEYTKNVDAYRASCIFVYTGEDGAKIEARPLWDQELSFNNQCPNYMTDYGSNSSDGLLIQNSKVHEQTEKHIAAPFWFTGGGTSITGGLLSDPCFVQIVKEKWSKYSTGSGPLTEDVLMAKIEAYTTELGAAKNREADYWDSHSRSTLACPWDEHTTGYNNTDVSTSLETMTDWFASRGTGLTTAINGLTGTSFSIQILPTDQEVTPWIPAEIAISVEPEGYDYTLEYTGEQKLGDIANAIIEKEDNKITYRIPRPDAWETGNAEEGTRADFVYGIKATLNVAEGNMECGSQMAPSSIASITLQDEENDECE